MNSRTAIIIAVVVLLVVGGLAYWNTRDTTDTDTEEDTPTANTTTNQPTTPATASSADIRTNITGRWQSTDDSRFRRTFAANGTVTDTYEGNDDATVNGQWSIVTDTTREPVALPDLKDATLLKVSFPEEALYFVVSKITATELEMMYVGTNSTLRFTRI